MFFAVIIDEPENDAEQLYVIGEIVRDMPESGFVAGLEPMVRRLAHWWRFSAPSSLTFRAMKENWDFNRIAEESGFQCRLEAV